MKQETFRGEAINLGAIGADVTVSAGGPRIWRVAPTVGGRSVTLPDARKLQEGGPHYYVVNGGTQSVTVKDNGAGTLHTLAADKALVCCLVDGSTAAGTWLTIEKDLERDVA